MIARLYILIISLCGVVLLSPNDIHSSPDISASGYIRNFLVISDSDNDTAVEVLSRARIKLDIVTSESITWELAYEILPWLRDDGGILSDRSFAKIGKSNAGL